MTDITETVAKRYYELCEERLEHAMREGFDGWIEFQPPTFMGQSKSTGEMVVAMDFALHPPGEPKRKYPNGTILRIGPWGRA